MIFIVIYLFYITTKIYKIKFTYTYTHIIKMLSRKIVKMISQLDFNLLTHICQGDSFRWFETKSQTINRAIDDRVKYQLSKQMNPRESNNDAFIDIETYKFFRTELGRYTNYKVKHHANIIDMEEMKTIVNIVFEMVCLQFKQKYVDFKINRIKKEIYEPNSVYPVDVDMIHVDWSIDE